jgi:general stress protein 26
MEERDVRRACLDLMAMRAEAYLSTIGPDGFPRTRAMLNLRSRAVYPGLVPVFAGHDEDFLLYFTTNTSSAKMRQIAANPAVAVYYCDPAGFHGLQLLGRIEVVEDPATKGRLWQEGWERYYPLGPTDPDYAILRLRPARISGWYRAARYDISLR